MKKPILDKVAWRQRKLEKRDKQRAISLLRAEKMPTLWHKAGFGNKAVKKVLPANQYYVGCSGWFYWDWKGNFYPQESSPNTWFTIYSKQFKTVELNAPFYSWPTLSTVKTWFTQATRKDFIYAIKIPEVITHIKSFKGTQEHIKNFEMVAEVLGPKMGCFLYQLPPSFKYTPTRLKNIVAQLNPKLRNVVEFRHASWWNEKVYAEFKAHKIIFCSVSAPRLPDELIKTTDEIYVRFHGKTKWYNYDYSHEELSTWAQKIKACKAKQVWVYFNNDRNCYSVKNAKALMRKLK